MGKKQNLKETQSDVIVKSEDVTFKNEVADNKEENLSPELTPEILELAISIFTKANPALLWEEITQEERWKFIAEARK